MITQQYGPGLLAVGVALTIIVTVLRWILAIRFRFRVMRGMSALSSMYPTRRRRRFFR